VGGWLGWVGGWVGGCTVAFLGMGERSAVWVGDNVFYRWVINKLCVLLHRIWTQLLRS
jgi:hypothetical protein